MNDEIMLMLADITAKAWLHTHGVFATGDRMSQAMSIEIHYPGGIDGFGKDFFLKNGQLAP